MRSITQRFKQDGATCRPFERIPKAGAATITPNVSRSSPDTHEDYPDRFDGRDGGGPQPSSVSSGVTRAERSATIAAAHFFDGHRAGGRAWRRRAGAVALLAALSSTSLLAQTPDTAMREAEPGIERLRPDEPIDLTLEMYLRRGEREESIFTKRDVDEAAPQTPNVLDTINPKGKEGEITIPLRGYPAPDHPPTPKRPIYMEGSIGLHTTAMLRGGFSGTAWPFDYHALLDYGSSDGFVDNGESSHLSAALGGGYVIGRGYGIFSGGHMGAKAGYAKRTYRLYAQEAPPKRESGEWSGELTGSAALGGLDLKGEASVRRMSMTQTIPLLDEQGPAPVPQPDTQTIAETSIEGRLKGRTRAIGLEWEGNLDLRLTESTPGAINYAAFDLGARLELPILTIQAGGMVGAAGGSDGTTTTAVAPRAEVRLLPVDGVSISGTVSGGVWQMSGKEMLRVNPYALLAGPLMPEVEKIGYGVALHVEPGRDWGVKVAGSRREYDSYLHFGVPVDGVFTPLYDATRIDRIDGDIYINIGARDQLAAIVRYVDAELSDGAAVPYIPTWDAELFYARRLFNIPLTVSGSFRFIGERQGSTGTLDPAFLIGFDWAYGFGRTFEAVVQVRNLLGQDYQRWEGYEERGLFVAIGARTRIGPNR